jgi:hypothetical protein
VSDPASKLSVLRVLNGSGDTSVSWDPDRVAAGDPEAQAAVREAERIFHKARADGAQAFQVMPHAPTRRVEQFNPEAEEVLLIPPMVGG